jgi:hypothetical protein
MDNDPEDLPQGLLRLAQRRDADVLEALRRAKVIAVQLSDEKARTWVDHAQTEEAEVTRCPPACTT